ncbi:MAG: hypothetical protein GXX83_11595 [Gaiellales bacterium]|nr:hypothetical protein [Gaiellales bacterium]
MKVRSEDEILSTLDDSGRCMGLGFMPEQKAFCGREFRVVKIVQRIMLETNSELRTMKSPTLFLEGVFCSGEFHGNCDRSCYLFWKEPWLERVTKG